MDVNQQRHFRFPIKENWYGTLLGIVTPDLYPVIALYHKKPFGLLKPSYTFKSEFPTQGTGGNAPSSYPYGCAVDWGTGNYFIVMRGKHEVQVYQNGVFIRSFGEEGFKDGQFRRPCAIMLDFDGNVVVVDRDNHRLQVFDPTGKFKFKFGQKGSEFGQFDNPMRIAIDNDGNFLVSDYGNHRIQTFTSKGQFIRAFGTKGTTRGKLNGPIGVAVDTNSNIIVTEFFNHRAQVFDSYGQFSGLNVIGGKGKTDGKFSFPVGVTVDGRGNVVIVDESNKIQLFTQEAKFLMKVGADDHMTYPQAPVLDKDGNLIVCDSQNHRIVIFG